MDDLLDVDIGKHDYDWLLTPPGTPRELKLELIEKKPVAVVTAPKRAPTRSSSTTRASRLSGTTQLPENGHTSITTTRPGRSSSVTRSSIQSSSNIRNTTALNTSTTSLSSRPSTPTKRAPSLTSPRPSAPITTTRTVPTRSSTPVKPRSSAPVSKPTPSSRSSTPTRHTPSRSSTPTRPRAGTSASSTYTAPPSTRPGSRSSTPTRTVSSSPAIGRSPSVSRTSSSSSVGSIRRVPSANGLSSAPTSRPSSPSQRSRAPVRPLDIPDFPNETPPNLRTKLPDRPTSAGRVRPGMALTSRSCGPSAPESVAAAAAPKKAVVSQSKFSDMPSKVSSMGGNGHHAKPAPVQKSAGSGSDSGGFGRNISKKSLDMAIRHMDIRQNLGGIKGASLFPHSIRSNSTKGRPARMSDPTANRRTSDIHSENGSCNGTNSDNSKSTANNSPDRNIMLLKETLNELDLYGSSRYDAMLLREDAKSTNWLHGIDDKSDQSPVFDHRFEPLPEPFGPL